MNRACLVVRTATIRVIAFLCAFALVAPTPARAFDVDTHYVWTYYLALHAGFTERQAYQIASATFAIDHDAQTGPMEASPADAILGSDRVLNLTPEQKVALDLALNLARTFITDGPDLASSDPPFLQQVGLFWWLVGLDTSEFTLKSGSFTPPIRNVWSNFHAFAESQIVKSGRRLFDGPPTAEDVRRVGDIQILRSLQQAKLWQLGLREGNPGAFMHYLQDSFPHGPYDNVRGHAFDGHWPDFLSAKPNLSQTMTERSLEELTRFRCAVFPLDCPGRIEAERKARIVEVLAEMIAANDTPGLVANLDVTSTLRGSAPNQARAQAVVTRAIAFDLATGTLPRDPARTFPELATNNAMPRRWIQFDFDVEGRVAGHEHGGNKATAQAFGLEGLEFKAHEVDVRVRPTDSAGSRFEVDLSFQYTLGGLKNLGYAGASDFLYPLPVYEHCGASDFPSGGNPHTPHRENGTYTVTSGTLRRTRADLMSLVWRCTVQAYGLPPAQIAIPLAPHVPAPRSSDQTVDSVELGDLSDRMHAAAAAATAAVARGRQACVAAAATAPLGGVTTDISEGVAAMLAEVETTTTRAAGLDQLNRRARAAADDAYAAAQDLAALRDRAGNLQDAACLPSNAASDDATLAARAAVLREVNRVRLFGGIGPGGGQILRRIRNLVDDARAADATARALSGDLAQLSARLAQRLQPLEQAAADTESGRSALRTVAEATSDLKRAAATAEGVLAEAFARSARVAGGTTVGAQLGQLQGLIESVRASSASPMDCQATTDGLDREARTIAGIRTAASSLAERMATLRASTEAGGFMAGIAGAAAEAEATLAVAEAFDESIANRLNAAFACASAARPVAPATPSNPSENWLAPERSEAGTPVAAESECSGPRPRYESALRRLEAAMSRQDVAGVILEVGTLRATCEGDAARLAGLRDLARTVAKAEADANASGLRSAVRGARDRSQRIAQVWTQALGQVQAIIDEVERAKTAAMAAGIVPAGSLDDLYGTRRDAGGDRAAQNPERETTGAGSSQAPATPSEATCLVDSQTAFAPERSGVTWQYYISELPVPSRSNLSAFKIDQVSNTFDKPAASSSGPRMHGPYASQAAARAALDRLCPVEKRSTGGVRFP